MQKISKLYLDSTSVVLFFGCKYGQCNRDPVHEFSNPCIALRIRRVGKRSGDRIAKIWCRGDCSRRIQQCTGYAGGGPFACRFHA